MQRVLHLLMPSRFSDHLPHGQLSVSADSDIAKYGYVDICLVSCVLGHHCIIV